MKPETQETPVVDPVCGMSVNPEAANIKIFIKEQRYYFPYGI